MGKWTREKVNSENLNSGYEYEAKDRLSREQLNAMVNSGLYAQDFAEHLADTPDTSDANNVGTPSVEFISNGAYKKFKFSNLKGEKGEQGIQGIQGVQGAKGDKGDKGDTGENGVSVTHSWNGTTLTVTSASGTSSANLKGEKGDKGDSGEIYQSTGTSTTGAMSQDATTRALNTTNSNISTNTNSINSLNTNKANKDLSNVTYPTNSAGSTNTGAGDRVVETYISDTGKTWYRKWASGWKECGMALSFSGGTTTIILPLEFSSTHFTPLLSADANNIYPTLRIIIRSVEELSLFAGIDRVTESTYGGTFYVYCCGY